MLDKLEQCKRFKESISFWFWKNDSSKYFRIVGFSNKLKNVSKVQRIKLPQPGLIM